MTVHFEFVGIVDVNDGLEELVEADQGVIEVWYDLYERLSPMERRKSLLRDPSEYMMNGGLHRRKLTVYSE
jgi:hypothetical protein